MSFAGGGGYPYTHGGYEGGHHEVGLDIWSYLARLGVQMRGASDEFFTEGDKVCAMRTCQYLTQIDLEELLHKDHEEFSCQVPGCQAKFKQLIDNESHYNAKHRHSCSTCRKNLPSAHLLDLHISETHDTYFQLMAMKKASYECFVQTCSNKFWNPKERRGHCIGVHSFPHDFKFDPVKKKSDGNAKKAGSASPEIVKKRSQKKAKVKVRPASVFVAPMETETHSSFEKIEKKIKSDFTSSPPTAMKSRLPVLNRRLSLNVKDSSGLTTSPAR